MGCWDNILKGSPEIVAHLKKQSAGIDYNPTTKEGRDEYIKAAKELQDHSLNTINNIYADLKIGDYKKIEKPIEPKQEPSVSIEKNIDALKDKSSTAKALNELSNDEYDKLLEHVNENESVTEAYHKAKADGSNPELVKAVEDAVSEKQKPVSVSIENKNDVPVVDKSSIENNINESDASGSVIDKKDLSVKREMSFDPINKETNSKPFTIYSTEFKDDLRVHPDTGEYGDYGKRVRFKTEDEANKFISKNFKPENKLSDKEAPSTVKDKEQEFKNEFIKRGLNDKAAEGSSKMLAKALEDKKAALTMLQPNNKISRELWSNETGVKLPNTVGGTKDAIENYFTIKEGGFKPFEDIVNSSNSLKEAIEKVNKKTDVPPQVAKAFRDKYDPKKELTPEKAFEKFYDEIKDKQAKSTTVKDNTQNKVVENKAEGNRTIGDEINIAFAGSKIKGTISKIEGDKITITDKAGYKYPVRESAILKEGQSAKDFYDTEAGKTEKVYEEIIGARPNTKTGRIPVDPIISGNKPKRISDILFDVSKAIGKKINYNKPSRSRAIGTYSPSSAVIKIRFAGDLDTTAHEIGHNIDDNFGVLKDLKTTPNKLIEDELKPFSKHGSDPPAKHPDKRMYRLGEGFAEWLRAYIVNPAETIKAAPETHKLYESKVSDEYKKGLRQFSDDIRTWAAASGRDMVLSNIEWKPDENKKGIISKIFGKSDNADMFEVSWVDKVAANFTNPLQAFDKSIQYAAGIKGLDELLPKNDPTILARLLLSIDRKFGSFLETGFRDANDKLLTDKDGNAKTFNWLLEPLDNTDEATVKKEMEDTLAYMVAERTVGLGERFDRENILSGIGGGIFKDVDVAKKTLDEFNNGDPQKLSRIKEAAERYRSYANDVLDYLVDKGRLTKEILDKNGNLIGGVDLIKKNNLQYVALQRVMESAPNEEIEAFNIGHHSNRLGSKSEPIYTIKGSTRTIRNPYISLLDATYKGIKEADRNNVLRQYRDLLTQGRTMYEGVPIKLGEIGYVAKSGESNTIPIFIDGKLENWKFNDDIYKGLKGLDSDGYKLPAILTLHARVLRSFITKFPVFAARNWVRDLQDRIIKSDSGIKDLFGDKKHWEDVARNGGLNAGYYMRGKEHYYGLMEEAIKDLSKDKKTIFSDPSKIKKVWHGYEDFLQKSETANRVAEYRNAFAEAKKKGLDDYNASLYGAFRSRDLMDFSLMGHYMKIVNQVIPFSNAAIQGLRSTVVRAAENPTAFLARLAIYTIIPQVALWGWNHRNNDDAEEYEALPQYQRDMFWNFKIGENKWVSIPKPYELGLFASGVDRGLSKIFGFNDNAFSGYAGSVFQTVSPFDVGSLSAPAQPFVEAYTNKSLYSGKHIIPQQEDALDLSLRHTESATRLGQFIQSFTGIDARKMDYIIKNQFGYTGNLALDVADVGKANSRHTLGLHDLGFFNQSPAYNSTPVQNMVEFAEKYNLKQSREYVYFNKIAGKYFDAKTEEEKDDIAKQLVEAANKNMERWDKQKIADKKINQFKKKK